MTWVVVPAAGRGLRLGGEIPKQYLTLNGRPLIQHTLERVAAHRRVSGLMIALAAGDAHWPGWSELEGKPVRTCIGGGERADSVLAGLRALPSNVHAEDWVLVHDAARPCLRREDLDRLLERGAMHAVGAILAAPVRDTLKRADSSGAVHGASCESRTVPAAGGAGGRSSVVSTAVVACTEPREQLWRAFTPQMFRRGALERALDAARRAGVVVTDEAMAMERLGCAPLLVEGAEDNIKVTTPADLALAEFLLARLDG